MPATPSVRSVVLRVSALALLLLLVLVAVLSVRTLNRLPDATIFLVRQQPTGMTLEPVFRRLRAGAASAAPGAAERWAAELLAALAAGPTAEEAAAGLSSALPADARLLGARLDDDTLVLDLSPEIASGGGSALMQARLYQLLYSFSQPAAVEAVALHIDGEPVRVFSGEGLLLAQPWVRAEHADAPRW